MQRPGVNAMIQGVPPDEDRPGFGFLMNHIHGILKKGFKLRYGGLRRVDFLS